MGAQEASPPPPAAGDTVGPADPRATPPTSMLTPRGFGVSHAVIGSKVRLQYTASISAGTLDRFSVVEGTLADTDDERFTIVRSEGDTAIVPRRQATSIMVREEFAKWPTAIGAGLFGVLIGHVFASQARGLMGPGHDVRVLPWVAGPAVAGVAAVVLTRSGHWVTTTFPP